MSSAPEYWALRITGGLFGAFGALAMFVALVGIYAVMSYAVARRTREIGIRMAVGAMPGTVKRMILGEGLTLTLTGVGLGLLLGLGVGRMMGSMFVDLPDFDPITFTAVPVAFIAAAAHRRLAAGPARDARESGDGPAKRVARRRRAVQRRPRRSAIAADSFAASERADAVSWKVTVALFPQSFIDEVRAAADIVAVVSDSVSLRKAGSHLQGPVPVPRREDAVVHRQQGQGLLPLLRLRRRRRRLQVHGAAGQGRLPGGGPQPRAALRHSDPRTRSQRRTARDRPPNARRWSRFTRSRSRISASSSNRRPARAFATTC